MNTLKFKILKINMMFCLQEEVIMKEIIVQCDIEEDLDVEFAMLEEQFTRNMEAFFKRTSVNRSEFERKALILENHLNKDLNTLTAEREVKVRPEQMSDVEDVLTKCRSDRNSIMDELNEMDLLLLWKFKLRGNFTGWILKINIDNGSN